MTAQILTAVPPDTTPMMRAMLLGTLPEELPPEERDPPLHVLCMRTALPQIQVAVRARQLQCYKYNYAPPAPPDHSTYATCWYQGPCGVGSALPPHVRVLLDSPAIAQTVGPGVVYTASTDVGAYVRSGVLALAPGEDLQLWVILQHLHDSAVTTVHTRWDAAVAKLEQYVLRDLPAYLADPDSEVLARWLSDYKLPERSSD